MPLKLEQKKEVIESIKGMVSQTDSLVFVNFHGLDVVTISGMRRSLKERGVGYKVVKKTLLRRALGELAGQVSGEVPSLDGEIALAYADSTVVTDAFLPARSVYDFQLKFPQGFKIAGGIFEQKFRPAAEMTDLAMIPPREILYGQLVSMLVWPLRRLVFTLSQISQSKAKA